MLRMSALVLALLAAHFGSPAEAQPFRKAQDYVKKVRDLNQAAVLRTDTDKGILRDWCDKASAAIADAQGEIASVGACLEPDDATRERIYALRDRVGRAGGDARGALAEWSGRLRDENYRLSDGDIQKIRERIAAFANDAGGFAEIEVVLTGWSNQLGSILSSIGSSRESAKGAMKNRLSAYLDLYGQHRSLREQERSLLEAALSAVSGYNDAEARVRTADGNAKSAEQAMDEAERDETRLCDEYLRELDQTPGDPSRSASAKRAWEDGLAKAKDKRNEYDSRCKDRRSAERERDARLEARNKVVTQLNEVRERLEPIKGNLDAATAAKNAASDEFYKLDLEFDKHSRWQAALKKECG